MPLFLPLPSPLTSIMNHIKEVLGFLEFLSKKKFVWSISNAWHVPLLKFRRILWTAPSATYRVNFPYIPLILLSQETISVASQPKKNPSLNLWQSWSSTQTPFFTWKQIEDNKISSIIVFTQKKWNFQFNKIRALKDPPTTKITIFFFGSSTTKFLKVTSKIIVSPDDRPKHFDRWSFIRRTKKKQKHHLLVCVS